MRTVLPSALAFLSLSTLLAETAPAQTPAHPDLVHMRLVADTTAVQPGKPFGVGLLVDIAPGWHVYWTNPGDSGQATTARFNLPPGFKVSDLRYPAPSRFNQPGDIVGYGYHSKVLFTATVTPPADLKPGQEIAVSATLNYLACDRVCIPGKLSDSKLIPVSEDPRPDNVDLFLQWLPRIPTPADQSPAVESVESDPTSVTVHWKTPPKKDVEFFPGPSDVAAIGNITVLNNPRRTQILFTPKVYDKSKLEPVASVLAFTGADDIRRAISFTHSLKDESGKK
jgi:thiol:disulfide interchange protein DsbD